MREFIAQESIRALIRQVFGSDAELASMAVMSDLPDYRVLRLTLRRPDTSVVLKLAGPTAPRSASFDRTAALYSLVFQQADVSVPRIYAADVSCRDFPLRYLLMGDIQGVEWATAQKTFDRRQRQDALRQLGEAVAKLHLIQFPHFGELDENLRVVAPAGLYPALRARATRIIRDPALLDFFLAVLERDATLFQDDQNAALTHEDLHGYNILVTPQGEGWRLAAILDFDKAWAGPPESDLARMSLWTGMTGGAFWSAYRSVKPIPAEYEQREALYQLLWCLEYAAPTRKHRADTRRVCRRLGLEPPDILFP